MQIYQIYQVYDIWMFSLRRAAKVLLTHPLPSPCSPASRWPAWHSRRRGPCQEHLWRWSQNSGLATCQPPGDRPAQGKEWHQFTLGLAKAPSTIPGPRGMPIGSLEPSTYQGLSWAKKECKVGRGEVGSERIGRAGQQTQLGP